MRILMLVHIDWSWIWQRPQAMATALSAWADVRVIYRLNPFRGKLVANPSPLWRQPFLPLPERLFPLLSQFAKQVQVSSITRTWVPDVVWVTHPDLSNAIPNAIRGRSLIVYDCMDLAAGFVSTGRQREKVLASEADLISQAGLILCSSSSLMETIRVAKPTGRIVLIENALDAQWLGNLSRPQPRAKGPNTKLLYFGTISHWLDWRLIQRCLEERFDLEFIFIGPCEQPPPFRHPRLVIHDAVPHTSLPRLASTCDGFILPFVVNELTRHVNPVKLYEYLSFGKPVFCIDYIEIQRFLPFVELFSSAEDLLSLLRHLGECTERASLHRQQVVQFLADNTWAARSKTVRCQIDACISSSKSAVGG